MVFHEESLGQIDNDTKNKHCERVRIIRRNILYEFYLATLKNLLYMTKCQALMTKCINTLFKLLAALRIY